MKKIILTMFLLNCICTVSAQNYFQFNGAADVNFRYQPRGSGGRALVHGTGNKLILNYGKDFSGGTEIHGPLYVGTSNKDNYFQYNGGADLSLRYKQRGSGGRALVHNTGNTLVLNYGRDFSGGTEIHGPLYVGTSNKDNYFQYNGGADLSLRYKQRGSGGRALVHNSGNKLVLNYGNDFSGGTEIHSNTAVLGKLEAKEIKVTLTPTADFVFEDTYDLPSLNTIEKYIGTHKHLPEIASAKEMEAQGVNIGTFQIQLLQKIEELTLYTIAQEKEIKRLKQQQNQVEILEQQNQALLSKLNKIEKKLASMP